MIALDITLPPGALLPDSARAFDRLAERPGTLWYRAAPDHLEIDPDSMGDSPPITGWRAVGDGPTARPTRPNKGHSRYGMAQGAMLFRAGVHCGFSLPLPDAAPGLAFLIRYRSPGNAAETLIGFETSGNLMFLIEREGQVALRLADRDTGLVAPVAEDRHGWRSVAGSIGADGACLMAGSQPLRHAAAIDPALPAPPGEVFIGCRRHRAGLLHTLGDIEVGDVMLWPGASLAQGGLASAIGRAVAARDGGA